MPALLLPQQLFLNPNFGSKFGPAFRSGSGKSVSHHPVVFYQVFDLSLPHSNLPSRSGQTEFTAKT
jgi:hypothetical protein